MDRRSYLATGVAIGAGALAGCSFTAAASSAPPEIPQEKLDSGGWERTGEETGTVFEEPYGPVTVTGVQHTLQYADEALQSAVAERSLGEVQADFAVFFASHIDFSPNLDNLPAGVGREEILARTRSTAREQFKQQMRDQGLQDIEKTGEGSIEIDTGETAETDKLNAVFPFQGITFDVTEEESVEIPAAEIDVAATMAVWHHGDFVIVSGGAHPTENFATSVDEDLSEGVSVSVDVDLGLQPDTYREEIRGLIASVQ